MSYTWNVNWRSLFSTTQSGLKNETKKDTCKVRCRLVSRSTNTLTNTNIVSFRLSLQSNTSRVSNGFNVGSILIKKELFTPGYKYLDCNTLDTEGFTMLIPKEDNSNLTLSFYDNSETLITANIPQYQVWLYFDVEDDLF
jgi:hypothetical protein